MKGVKRAFIGSGIRYDMFIGDADQTYLREVVTHHVSGRLKVAPEHTEDHVVKLMRKPPFELYHKLQKSFQDICRSEQLKYRLVPYFISSHPGCTERDMRKLADRTARMDMHLEQVQDFTPTPMTLSSVMYATGMNPYTGEKLFVARNQDDKRRQKSYFFRPDKKRHGV